MLLKARGAFSTLKCFTFRGTLTSIFGVFVLWRKLMKRENTRSQTSWVLYTWMHI